MKKVSEYFKEKMPGVALDLVDEVIMNYASYIYSIRGNFCDICYKKLSDDEKRELSSMFYLNTCKEHQKYRMNFQISLIRQELGIPHNPKLPHEWYDI